MQNSAVEYHSTRTEYRPLASKAETNESNGVKDPKEVLVPQTGEL